jgi:hypothetical protein
MDYIIPRERGEGGHGWWWRVRTMGERDRDWSSWLHGREWESGVKVWQRRAHGVSVGKWRESI